MGLCLWRRPERDGDVGIEFLGRGALLHSATSHTYDFFSRFGGVALERMDRMDGMDGMDGLERDERVCTMNHVLSSQ